MDLEFDNYDYYDILNVPPNATQDEIKSSYRKLIRLWHPDKHSSNPELLDFNLTGGLKDFSEHNVSNEIDDIISNKRDSAFTKIQKAYSVLSDPILRGQYDKYGHEGATLARLIMNEKVTERSVYTIQEDLSETNTPKQEILNLEKDEDYVARRVFLLLRDRYSRELKMLPFQLVTSYTFNARSDLFADDSMFGRKAKDGYMGSDVLFNKKAFYISGMSLDNSVELLYKKVRFGVSLSSVLSRGTFGNSFGRVYISSEISDNVELRASADSMDFFSPRLFMLSLKKKFSDTFWSTFILTLSNKLNPNLYAVFHKAINKRHSVELTLTNGLFLNYSYLKVLNKYTKVNLKAITTPDNIGLELRFKTLNVFGSTLGSLVRLCLMNGLTFEWFFRTLVESSYLGVMKVEYRLCFNNDKVVLLLKGMINNSKVNLPILLYKGDKNYSIYLASLLTFLSLMFPLFWKTAHNVFDNVSYLMKKNELSSGTGDEENKIDVLNKLSSIISTEDEELYKNPLRNNFYSSFPQFSRSAFSYIANSNVNNGGMGYSSDASFLDSDSNTNTPYMYQNLDYELRHIKYYQYPPLNRKNYDTDENNQYDNKEQDNKEDNKNNKDNKETEKEANDKDMEDEEDMDRKVAIDENNKLYNMAKMNYFKEFDKKGLVVLLAVYGHPRLVEYLNENYHSIEFSTNSYSNHEDEMNELLNKLKREVEDNNNNNKENNKDNKQDIENKEEEKEDEESRKLGHTSKMSKLTETIKSKVTKELKGTFIPKENKNKENDMEDDNMEEKVEDKDNKDNKQENEKESYKERNKNDRLNKIKSTNVINVTNILMSRVNNSSVYLSSSNKDNLIGFYNPCKQLKLVPKLVVVYKYGNEVKSVVYNNNQSVLIP